MFLKLAMSTLAIVCAIGLALFMLTATMSSDRPGSVGRKEAVYSPYPFGQLPADLQAEADRVNGEIDRLEQEAISQWRALPMNGGVAMRQVQLLGKIEMYDKNLSVNRNEACTFCHMPYSGFSGPISSLNATVVAYLGSVHYRFGKRKPQGYTYSSYYPVLQYNRAQGNFYGGNFWDMRATGYRTQSPDAEQAQGPPHDTQEMGLPDTACIVYRISQGSYADVFTTVWGTQAFAIRWPADVEKVCDMPGGAFGTNTAPLALKTRLTISIRSPLLHMRLRRT